MSIFDALKNSVLEGFDTTLTASEILLNLGIALLAGLFILLIYRFIQRSVAFNRGFGLTLLLVCSISAMIVLTITSNLALSLGMVGALSIVRFRTAIKDASDTAFMFWAVAAGITAGAGFYLLTLIGCLFVGLICIVSVVLLAKTEKPFLLIVRSALPDAPELVEEALRQLSPNFRLSSMIAGNGSVELIYELGISDKNRKLVQQLSQLEGMLHVSLVDCHKSV